MRRAILFSLVFAGVATPLLAIPQTGGGSSSSSGPSTTVTVRARCSDCRPGEEGRLRRQLVAKIDSLKWEFENSRLTQAQRDRLSESLTQTLNDLMEMDFQSEIATAAAGSAARATARASAGAVAGARVRSPMASGFSYSYSSGPRGYIGVTFDAPSTEDVTRNGEHFVRFYRYPRIILVEPDSPAEKGGVLEGDTLLSLNGDDVKESPISFSKLLVPDARIVMRVKREGDTKDLKIKVGEAPNYYTMRMAPMVAAGVRAPVAVRVPFAMPTTPEPPAAVTMPALPRMVWITGDGVAGARVQTITEGLSKTVGTERGVLVLSASSGTPAFRSGLRDGDIILRAGGENIATVRDLLMQVNQADKEDGVRLVILREKKTKELTLRW